MKRVSFAVAACFILLTSANAQKNKSFTLLSPDGSIVINITAEAKLRWSVMHQSQVVLAPSAIALHLLNGKVLGDDAEITGTTTDKVNTTIPAMFYKKSAVVDNYNQLVLNCRGDWGVIFRAYNDGIAYRFFTSKADSITIQSEEATFNFTADDSTYIPYANDPHNHDKYQCSFENTYRHIPLSEIAEDTVAFAPILVETGNRKAAITEADLEDYPGMFLSKGTLPNSLAGNFASYPTAEMQGGHNNLQSYVTQRANYIARTNGRRSFPWRVVIISMNDKDLLNSDMVYRLAAPSRVQDASWIKPGKVAWDWWNDWNISHVNFHAGINTTTYKYYIDFAAANHIEYILLDEGWANSLDIMQIVPEINLQEIIDYGKQKNVGVWLWGGWLPLDRKIDEALSKYSKMGIKGFKIDFMDRDDQKMVQFYYRMAAKAAQYHLLVDYHGAYKPTGLQRTFPNVLNFEGVHGMEQLKWSNPDMPAYDVTIPFIRMIAGPMDYTPGAMRNATKESFRSVNSMPMSQGTRCHQLAMYVLFEAPFEMLADNPTAYTREKESLDFISGIPTTFDETVAIAGKVGSYAAIARRKGDTWYVGAMNNWNPADITIDLSFLPAGNYQAEIYRDGMNADRDATDYEKSSSKFSSKDAVKIHLAGGGGWVAKVRAVK